MARRRYYYRTRRTVPKQKWLTNMCAVNINSVSGQVTTIGNSYSYIYSTDIIRNTSNKVVSPDTTIYTNATILKTGRWKCKGIISSGFEAFNYLVGLMYIPEGYTITNTSTTIDYQTVIYQHPEWVLCWKRFDYTNAGQSNEFSLSSRLKRNLNSGDRVIMFLLINNSSGNPVNIVASTNLLRATVTYVCRSN